MGLSWLTEAAWLNRRRVTAYPKIFLVVFILSTLVWWVPGDGLLDRSGIPIGSDFISYWSASFLSLRGEGVSVYEPVQHYIGQQQAVGRTDVAFYAAWFYPPMYLAVVLPLALLPYGWSLASWLAITFVAYLGVIGRIARQRQALWIAAAFSAVFVNVQHGQNGFLLAALLGGAMLLLDRRPWLAGILIGLMAFKPQFGVLIPLALIADARWPAFISATITTAVFGLASWVLFGAELAFFEILPDATKTLETGGLAWAKIQSPFSAVALLGAGVTTAYIVHGIVAAGAAVATVWAWRQPVATHLKAAVLATGALLVTPHVFDYDFIIMALPIAWLACEGMRSGFLAGEKTMLVVAWLVPLVSRLVASHTGVSLGPLVVIALLIVIVRRIAVARAQDAPATLATGIAFGKDGAG